MTDSPGVKPTPPPSGPLRPPFRLEALAAAVGGRVLGDSADLELKAIRTLASAQAGDLSFLHAAPYREEALASKAGAFLLPEGLADFAPSLGRPTLVVEDSHLALARLIGIFHPRRTPAPGIHATAVVAEHCEVADDVHIGPYAVVGEGSRIGPGSVIEAHVTVGRDCTIGAGSWLHPNVVLYDATWLGERVEVHSGCVIGADGFGYATAGGVHHKVPQVGHVEIGDDVEIGANTTIDRALLEKTQIGAGTKIDNLVQVGHNVETGRSCILCGQSGIAGSTKLGHYTVLAGQAGIVDHVELGDLVQVAAKSAVFEDVPAGTKVGGVPATDLGSYRRQVAVLGKLPGLMRRLRRIERRIDEIENESTRA